MQLAALDLSSIYPYLLGRGLLTHTSVVKGDLSIVESPHRNANYKVVSEHGPSYLVKQGVGADREATVAREAAVYGFLGLVAEGGAIRDFMPRCCLYDPDAHVLVLELVKEAEDLAWHYQRVGRFSIELARKLGVALGTIHKLGPSAWADYTRGTFSSGALLPPSVLTIHRPGLDRYTALSGANLQLLRIIQQFPQFGLFLDSLRQEWRADCFLHGDLKWGNILSNPEGRDRRPRLKIVDWEMAGLGDPCWDAGTIFSNYLTFWLLSVPITGKEEPDRYLGLARYPLARLQPSIDAFWSAYTQTMELDLSTGLEWLDRAVRYCAARLVQTAFDESQNAAEPTGNVICMLQLSLNMFQRPRHAATHLLGIR